MFDFVAHNSVTNGQLYLPWFSQSIANKKDDKTSGLQIAFPKSWIHCLILYTAYTHMIFKELSRAFALTITFYYFWFLKTTLILISSASYNNARNIWRYFCLYPNNKQKWKMKCFYSFESCFWNPEVRREFLKVCTQALVHMVLF